MHRHGKRTVTGVHGRAAMPFHALPVPLRRGAGERAVRVSSRGNRHRAFPPSPAPVAESGGETQGREGKTREGGGRTPRGFRATCTAVGFVRSLSAEAGADARDGAARLAPGGGGDGRPEKAEESGGGQSARGAPGRRRDGRQEAAGFESRRLVRPCLPCRRLEPRRIRARPRHPSSLSQGKFLPRRRNPPGRARRCGRSAGFRKRSSATLFLR